MSRWFRMYDEILDDPKVQKLPPEDFRAWVNLLCLASRNGGKLPPINDIAFALRRSPNDAETLVERLLNATLIDRRNGGANGVHYAPHGWDKRQYKSDTSTERVKRFRNAAKAVTVTPPDTDTESDTEQTPQTPHSDKHSSEPNKPPADRSIGRLVDVEFLVEQGCQLAGLEPNAQAAVQFRLWLGAGIAEQTILETIRSVMAHSDEPTSSLRRFERAIRHAHAKTLAGPSKANGGGARYVSESGHVYRGSPEAVMREAEKRADWTTYYQAKSDTEQRS